MLTPGQVRAARALLNWTQRMLADKAGVSEATVVDFEKERRAVSGELVEKITSALERAGVEFLGNGKGPGVRLCRRS